MNKIKTIQHSEVQGQGRAEVPAEVGLRLGYGGNSEAHLAGREDFSFHALPADASSPTSCREFPWAKDQQTLEEYAWKLVVPTPIRQIKTGRVNPLILSSGKSFPLCETLSPRDLVLSLESPSPPLRTQWFMQLIYTLV